MKSQYVRICTVVSTLKRKSDNNSITSLLLLLQSNYYSNHKAHYKIKFLCILIENT